jgi:hypothetical protein
MALSMLSGVTMSATTMTAGQKAASPRILTSLPEDLIKRVDAYRFNSWSPSRTAAIRTLLEIGLRASEMPTNDVPTNVL